MKSKPLITVVTVTYNAEEFLDRTIKSVIEQDYKNIEYIIIDGSSTDGTIDIIKKYEKYISYWISEPDDGIYDAMNTAIDIASGEWIHFLNAGDVFTNNNILCEIINEVAKNTEVICAGVNVIENGKLAFYEPPCSLITIKERFPCNHQGMLIKVYLIRKLKFNISYKIAADADLMLKLYDNNNSFEFINIPLVDYLRDGYWNDNFVKAHIELLYIASQHSFSSKQLIKHTSLAELSKLSPILSTNSFATKLERLQLHYKNIAIYGYGLIGRLIYKYMNEKVSIVFDKFNYNNDDVQDIKYINQYEFDIIIISVLGSEDTIKEDLVSLGVDSKKIIQLIEYEK